MIKILISFGLGASVFVLVRGFVQHKTELLWKKGLGQVTPAIYKARRKRWSARLFLELADFMDLMALGLSSGLTLEQAWLWGHKHTPEGCLKRDLGTILDAIEMGRPKEEAFQDLNRRLGEERLQLFFALLVQSLRAGARLQNLFGEQATALRRTYLTILERRAQTAPLRLLIPLFIFIFPTMFLILFGPLLLRASQGLSLF